MNTYANPALARLTDPETSHAAAAAVKTSPLQDIIITHLELADLTMEEIADRSRKSISSIGPRFKPMIERGMIIDTGSTRPGASGQQRTIYALNRNRTTWRPRTQDLRLDKALELERLRQFATWAIDNWTNIDMVGIDMRRKLGELGLTDPANHTTTFKRSPK